MKRLNSGHLRVSKNLSVIERCPLLGGNLKKIVPFAGLSSSKEKKMRDNELFPKDSLSLMSPEDPP